MSETKVMRVKCDRVGCGFELPIGYTSPRGYCATCEYKQFKKVIGESIDRSEALERVSKIALGAIGK